MSWLRGRRAGAVAVGMALALSGSAALAAPGADGEFIHPKRAISAPSGFATVCSHYSWACAGGDSAVDDGQLLKLAQAVNRRVNSGFRQVTDQSQYGVQEVWALPTGRGGDCEDFVLLKKLVLIKQGVPASRLLIATVLDRRRAPHAVLVLRTGGGDLVLDNLRTQIRPWNETGYTFLRMQNPDAPSGWQAVFAGGIFRDL